MQKPGPKTGLSALERSCISSENAGVLPDDDAVGSASGSRRFLDFVGPQFEIGLLGAGVDLRQAAEILEAICHVFDGEPRDDCSEGVVSH
ncbi:MAG: hypothetical protein Fues2KO_24280 [Fuerstiella sp.]